MEVNSTDTTKCLLEASGSDFFDELDDRLRTRIPVMVRNILLAMDIDRALLLSIFDDNSIHHIEVFMKGEFALEMICNGRDPKNCLGRFVNCQSKFVLSCGHKLMIGVIVETCRQLLNTSKNMTSCKCSADSSDLVPQSIPITSTTQEASLEGYENIELTDSFDRKTFSQYIGSLMITIFNDAKRLTLSGWSWPSRHVAAEKAQSYKVTGNSACCPILNYVTPTQHKEFLNCIVESDTKKLKDRLINSLALSLRVDGSVDRTQDHNVYVMGHVVNKDATTSTVFIGFDVPKQGKGLGYFECVKSVVEGILPWDALLHLLSSIVTDGEELNLGCHNGLHIRLFNEIRNLVSSTKPLLSIWCFAHRINLTWQDVCKECPIIGIIVAEAASLSSFFHKSGERTAQLERVAASENLNRPLRYVTYFPVRWTEYVYDLLRVTLRNWRASMAVFIETQQTPLQRRWLLYDRIHLVTFLTDVLFRFKKFQKSFESDHISILEVQQKKQKLFQDLEQSINAPIDKGWEQLFLANVYEDGDGEYMFFGHTLLRNCGRSTTQPTIVFNSDVRKSIIQSFLKHLSKRLDYDAVLQSNLQPLKSITSEVTDAQIKLCYGTIVPDLDENEFVLDYHEAANLLRHYEFKGPLETLQKIQILRPTGMRVLKIALARIVAAKPHSADVERLISTYNKIKTDDRSTLSGLSLYNYLYINTNMPNLDSFDPDDTVQHWMSKKNRRPAESQTRRQQEYFKGVFDEADQHRSKINNIVSF